LKDFYQCNLFFSDSWRQNIKASQLGVGNYLNCNFEAFCSCKWAEMVSCVSARTGSGESQKCSKLLIDGRRVMVGTYTIKIMRRFWRETGLFSGIMTANCMQMVGQFARNVKFNFKVILK